MAPSPESSEALTRERIQKIAALARLELTEAEATAFAGQLSSILGFFDAIQKVDVSGVAPMLQPIETETAFREDAARTFDSSEMLERAPEVIQGGYKVPQVV